MQFQQKRLIEENKMPKIYMSRRSDYFIYIKLYQKKWIFVIIEHGILR